MTPYCSAPWKGITVREDGNVRTCCAGKESLGNLNEKSIEEILQTDKLKEIKTSLANNQPHRNCQACYYQEEQGNTTTLRQHYQRNYPYTDDNIELRFLDIRWNNKCNLACQYCVPSLSSVWEKKLNIKSTSGRKNYQDQLLRWILSKSNTINEIMMVGGEPMLMKQNFVLLNKLPVDCKISIITNLNYDINTLSCYNDIVARPADNIIWNVSAENTGQQFEYVRNGSKWDEFEHNLQRLLVQWPRTVCLNMVYSMFNAFDFADIIKSYMHLGVKKFNLMPITENDAIDIFKWPEHTKQTAIAQLEEARAYHANHFQEDADLYPINGLDNLILDLQSQQNNVIIAKQEVIDKVSWYDQWHTAITFKQLWPHVWKEANKLL